MAAKRPGLWVMHLLYGLADTGKTWYCMEFCQLFGKRWLYFDTEGSTTQFEDAHQYSAKEPWGVFHVHRNSVREMSKMLAGLVARADEGKFPFDVVVVDGISEYQVSQGFSIAKENAAINPKLDEKKLDKQGWGDILAELLSNMGDLVYLHSLGVHVLMTAHVRITKDPIDPLTELLRPWVRGQFGDTIEHYFDVVTYCEKRVKREGGEISTVRRMFFGQLGDFLTKNRWEHKGVVPAVIEQPKAEDILKRLGILKEAAV